MRISTRALILKIYFSCQVFREGACVACDDPDGLCEDDVLDELPGAKYAEDLVLFIRRSFEPKLYEEALRYRLLGSI